MSTATPSKTVASGSVQPTDRLMTTEEFLALPDDGIERMLIRGRVYELGTTVTKRNRWHSRVELRIGSLLDRWLESRPEPRGELFSGEAGFRLRRDPDTTVGIDVAYASAETMARLSKKDRLIDGPPILAVEILSPSDEQETIVEKVTGYLEAGVKLVWVVETAFETVTVYRPDELPMLVAGDDELSGEPHLPGFRVPVSKFFSR
jgi:Uma2 family endonuclease